MDLGNVIKLIRTQKGMNQIDFSDLLGISQNYLSLIESNQKKPSDDKISIFAKSLGISKDALLFASSKIPQELSDEDKAAYRKLQNNITTLLLFGIDGELNQVEEK